VRSAYASIPPLFVSNRYATHQDLHSFPTRRSSDLYRIMDNSISEKEKMLAGKPYFANDKALAALRMNAQRLCHRYNQIDPKNHRERKSVIRSLFGQTGVMFCVEQPFYCDYGFNIEIGENFFSNYHLTILDCAPVKIGNNVMFGPNVAIYTAG